MTVKLVSVTPDAEQTMAYVARVSNPANQEMITTQVFCVTASNIITGVCLNNLF